MPTPENLTKIHEDEISVKDNTKIEPNCNTSNTNNDPEIELKLRRTMGETIGGVVSKFKELQKSDN